MAVRQRKQHQYHRRSFRRLRLADASWPYSIVVPRIELSGWMFVGSLNLLNQIGTRKFGFTANSPFSMHSSKPSSSPAGVSLAEWLIQHHRPLMRPRSPISSATRIPSTRCWRDKEMDQAISFRTCAVCFLRHELSFFLLDQVSTTQFCSFPSVLMVRARDGSDVPVSPLAFSSSNIVSPNGSSGQVATSHAECIQIRKFRPDAFPDSGLL